MKQLLTIAALMISVMAFSQSDTKGLGKVNKRQGIEIYIMSEPVRAYEVTGSVNKDDVSSILGLLNGQKDNRTILQMIDVLINNANRKMKKGKLVYDAIITEDGQTGTLIKFKEEEKKN